MKKSIYRITYTVWVKEEYWPSTNESQYVIGSTARNAAELLRIGLSLLASEFHVQDVTFVGDLFDPKQVLGLESAV